MTYNDNLTYDEAIKIINYNPKTGIFTWKDTRHNRVKVGSAAGCKNSDGYIKIHINGVTYQASRLAFLIMTGEWPKNDVDHIDQNKSNNKWSNIRPCIESENLINVKTYKSNTVGYKGVTKRKKYDKWRARIVVYGKRISLGDFDTPEAAARAYNIAAVKYYGEFAHLNKIPFPLPSECKDLESCKFIGYCQYDCPSQHPL